MKKEDGSIYDRIGGEEGIEKLINSFYERVLKDPMLAPYFEGVPMDKLARMQREFFAMATGGPAEYTGRPLAHVHQHLKIKKPVFQRFTEHLLTTLEETTDLSNDDIMNLISRVNVEIDEISVEVGGAE
ncbi:group 1 truncated hemoglobin [Verrucomicrobiales bacterium BCK34]|nr:group 1 truncated hemoglobin [Verrucomicrobiales bacterium BCK34]